MIARPISTKHPRQEDGDEREPLPLQKKLKNMAENSTTLQQAEDYILCTARLHLDALTTKWQLGTNRPINKKHRATLLTIFRNGGLQRTSKENFLHVLCTPDQVKEMQNSTNQQQTTDTIVNFVDWLPPTDTEKLEVVAGQHRISALHQYIQESNHPNPGREMWRTCILYNRGT